MKTRIKNLLLLLLLLALPCVLQAQDAFSTNADGSIYTYSTNADGSANIVAYAGPPWVVTIPTNINGLTVTTIGVEAFEYDSLTNVTIPDSVTSIGANVFFFCTNLTAITVDTNNPAYSSLNGVLFDKSQTTLIQYPIGLVGSYVIPNSVTSIGADAFANCTSLTSVTIPDSVTSIGVAAFDDTGLTSVTIPGSVLGIGRGAFAGCYSLTNATIEYGVINIGRTAFIFCTSLTSVTIPDSVTIIGATAFARTSLTSVTIPGSVISIGGDAFQYDYALSSVYFTGNVPSPTNDSSVFIEDPATVYYLPGTTGWGVMFDGLPTAPWFLPNPVILNNSAGFGVQPGGFGFTISWATNASVAVEAATNLANPVWIPVSTSLLTSGTSYFSDPQWTNYPMRFYRVTSAFTVGGTLTGLPAGDTVTLQDNGSDNLTLSANGTFTFPTALPDGQAYSVTVSGTGGGIPTTCTLANGSGNISGANVTNVTVQSGYPALTGIMDVDMYNAAVWDGTAHGGIPGIMFTENGGPFRVTAEGPYSDDIAKTYYGWAVFTHVVGTYSCSSTTLTNGGYVIQFGTVQNCGSPPRY